METNLTLKQQLILAITERIVDKCGIQDLTEGTISRIRWTANKLSEGFEESVQPPSTISLDAKLVNYGIKHRSLIYNDIETVGDLVRRTPNELLRLRNFGKGSLFQVEKFLERYNLKLKGR